MDWISSKIILIVKLILFPIFFLITRKGFSDYNDWFHEHYSDLLSTSVGTCIGFSHALQITPVTNTFTEFSLSVCGLVVKTSVGGAVAFFVNRFLKKYFDNKKQDKENEN